MSDALPFMLMGILGVLIGGRLVHILFYQFDQFVDNPMILITIGPGYFDEEGGRTTTTFTMELVGPIIMTGKETWYWVSDDDSHDTCTEGEAVAVATKMP